MNKNQYSSDSGESGKVSPDRLIGPDLLEMYNAGDVDSVDLMDLSAQIRTLLRHQREHWPALADGFRNLRSVCMRSIWYEGFKMKLQYNPGRIISTTAKVDKKSIESRTCFLCHNLLPPEQMGVPAGDYIILGNPFPVFNEHVTIPHVDHIPQLIGHSFEVFLDLTMALGNRFTLLYNGPRCGASAPDHLHFQGGERGFMPLDTSWQDLVDFHGKWIVSEDRIRVAKVDDGLRRFIVMESDDKSQLVKCFKRLYSGFKKYQVVEVKSGDKNGDSEEPLINILAALEDNRLRVIVFLRRKHRPDRYFLEGDQRVLFSPASIDFGGVCILPSEKDFERLTADDLAAMFLEVSATKRVLDKVAGAL